MSESLSMSKNKSTYLTGMRSLQTKFSAMKIFLMLSTIVHLPPLPRLALCSSPEGEDGDRLVNFKNMTIRNYSSQKSWQASKQVQNYKC